MTERYAATTIWLGTCATGLVVAAFLREVIFG